MPTPRIQLYLPYRAGRDSVHGRSPYAPRGNPERYVNLVRDAVRSVDPDLPISNVAQMEELLSRIGGAAASSP